MHGGETCLNPKGDMIEEGTDDDAHPSLRAVPQPFPSSRVGDALPGRAPAPAVALSHPKSFLAFRRGSCLLEGAREVKEEKTNNLLPAPAGRGGSYYVSKACGTVSFSTVVSVYPDPLAQQALCS